MTISEVCPGGPLSEYGAARWYENLSSHTFPTSFVKLRPMEVQSLAEGEKSGSHADEVIARLSQPMNAYPGNCFVFTDHYAPTDTERFALKGGAVYSPESAWKFLALSAKIRRAASEGLVEHLCVRPFRRITRPREFRLFIHKGVLSAMSQYWLVRHFRRLQGVRQRYWDMAEKFVTEISWLLPQHTLVMDVYFTAKGQILIIDINPWGPPTDPLLMQTWERDWDAPVRIATIIPPPETISGDVKVSF